MRSLRKAAKLTLLAVAASIFASSSARSQSAASGPRFEISFPDSVRAQPVTGRLFLMITRRNEPEVRLQGMTWFASPEILAVDVANVLPGQTVVVDSKCEGTPLAGIKDLTRGEYYVQAVLNVYTQFHRADGHVIWAHMDQWEGQQFNRSPGNPYSEVQKIQFDPASQETFDVTLGKVIPLMPPPEDTEWVKHVKIQSKLLSKFWGHPIYLGATILLPKNYSTTPDARYPVIYFQRGHFSLAAPFGFRTDEPSETPRATKDRQQAGYETGYEFYQAWQSEHFPRMIAVSFLDPTPLADWSGGVNSVNNGPYGDAITQELIPYIEERFRTISKPFARVLTGNASGGRQALALQLMHPELFGGAWIFEPWPFNFYNYASLNIYDDQNVFEVRSSEMPEWARQISQWLPTPRYAGRLSDGTPFITFRQLSQHDAVMAGVAAGDPIGADDAILGPVGANGYPIPLWDRHTGIIDREVARYWHDHGDLAVYAQSHWAEIGPNLVGKLHFYVGEMDHFYRNYGVHLFEDFLKTTRDPYYGGTFEYGSLKGDWQPMTNAQLVWMMAQSIIASAPNDASVAWVDSEAR
jgi:hypothetical protein